MGYSYGKKIIDHSTFYLPFAEYTAIPKGDWLKHKSFDDFFLFAFLVSVFEKKQQYFLLVGSDLSAKNGEGTQQSGEDFHIC